MPGSLQGSRNYKNIFGASRLWRQSLGRAGQAGLGAEHTANISALQLSWELFGFQSAAKASQQSLDKHTCPVPAVLPQGCCVHPGLGTEPRLGAGWSPEGFLPFHQSQGKAQVKGRIPHRASGQDLLDSHSLSE